jgi:heme-degrading monooxygenase HmoA
MRLGSLDVIIQVQKNVRGFLLKSARGGKIAVYARVTNIRFPPGLRAEVGRVSRGLASILRERRGFEGLKVLTEPAAGDGIIVSFWETEADAEVSESSPSYIGQMSMMSSFLYEPLSPKTYQVDVQA